MRRALGLAGGLAIVGLVIGAVIVVATSPIGPSGLGFIPYAGVGTLLVIRRPWTSIGWILLGIGSHSLMGQYALMLKKHARRVWRRWRKARDPERRSSRS